MNENKDEDNTPLDTVRNFPVGSPQSRAAARAACGAAGKPIVVSEYITGTRNEDGGLSNPRCVSKTATVNGKEFVRAEGESDADFRNRCFAACRPFQWDFVTFRGDAEE